MNRLKKVGEVKNFSNLFLVNIDVHLFSIEG